MKKIMTMIAAVATAFGLYAAGNTWSPSGDALGTTLDVLKADDGTMGVSDRYWSYSDSEGVAAGEAEVTAGGQLTLKTGSKILTRNIKGVLSGTETAFEPCDIPATSNEVGLFFDTKTIFGAPCDDFAALAETDKFAAFFLDETELGIGGITDAATNLWVIGSDGTTETAFRMQLWTFNKTPVTIDEGWLNAEKRVVVKAYANGNGTLPGFVVYVANGDNGNFATVIGKAPISNGTIGTYTAVSTANYLTGTIGVPGRYTDCQLVLGRVAAASLFGEAFKGTGTITDLTVGDTCPSDLTTEFTETQFMTVSTTDVTISEVTGATYNDGKFAGKNGNTVTFKATSTDQTKTLITISGVTYTENEGVYTITFNDQATLTVAAVAPAATVNGKAYATFADALGAAANLETVALTLNGAAAITAEENMSIEAEKVWTIDLNGQTLTFNLTDGLSSCIENAGMLTIKDSATGGKIVNIADGPAALISNTGTVAIQSGIFDGALFAEEAEGTYTISGGSFRSPDNGTDAFAYDVVGGKEATLVSGYWVVGEAPKTITVTIGAAAQNATIQSVLSNNVAVAYTAGDYVIPADESLTVTYAPNAGYEFKDGQAVWTLDTDGEASECPTATAIPVTSVTLDIASTNVAPADTFTLTATVTPGTALDKTIAWTTSDAAVATVADGVVTAVAEGTATITATNAASGLFATCTVTVAAPAPQEKDPEEPIIPPQGKSATEYMNELNANDGAGAAALVKAPACVTGADIATFKSCFKAVVDGDNVKLVLNEEKAATRIVPNLNTAEAAIVEGGFGSEVSVTVIPGLYYGITAKADVTAMAANPEAWVQATSANKDSFTLAVPEVKVDDVKSDKAFFQVKCSDVDTNK